MKTKPIPAESAVSRRAFLRGAILPAIASLLFIPLFMGGCATGPEAGGARVVEAAAPLEEALSAQAGQVEAASGALQKILATSGDEMVAAHSAFLDVLAKVRDGSERLLERCARWREAARENLAAWDAHQGAIQDESMRKTSAANRAAYADRFAAALRSVEEALHAQTDAIRLLEDSRKFLEDNLTVATVKTARGDFNRAVASAASGAAALRRAAAGVHDFSAATTPGR
ncbi:MAG: hypothetical protein LBG65_03590 [Puniceicoccales bacterium]|jgi:hypothetical protein|nr:hypothetical protein [Puniceicoccales bacterium]